MHMKQTILAVIVLLIIATAIAAGLDRVSNKGADTQVPMPTSTDGITAHTLRNTTWQWTGSTDSRGQTVRPSDPSRFKLTFGTDGRVTTSTDCNGASGIYSTQAEVLSMGQFMQTEMYCEGSLEQVYLGGLVTVNSYRIAGDTMTMIMHKDLGMMTFKAQ